MTIRQILTKYWGYSAFRPLQEEIIDSVLSGKDTLALLPTGGGKSICYQVPALAREGLCLVISPLIALMKDQVENLKKRNIIAYAIHSGIQQDEIEHILHNCVHGVTKLLYIAPERLRSERTLKKIEEMNINLIAVDEAHCISQWGYDFRPAYMNIATLRDIKPGVPFLALTATATPSVVKDIQEKLKFSSENALKKSFRRENLAYIVQEEENKLQRFLRIANKIKGSGIIYVRSRKKAKELSDFLVKNKVTSDYYHAGLKPGVRDKKQDAWMKDKVRVMVCTNAFGMGIDKPDVRFVVHYDLPESLEAYFQEAGRAGRDEKKSYAALLWNKNDITDLKTRIEFNYPEMDVVRTVYQCLANYFMLPVGTGELATFNFDIHEFCGRYNLNLSMVYTTLKLLEEENYISVSDAVLMPSKAHFKANKNELYRFQVANAKHDLFIKAMLRSYTGMFEDFVKINESEIAKRTGTAPEETVKELKNLHKGGILSYVPASDKPRLTFIQQRQDIECLYISKENLEFRRERAVEKMNAVVQYASLHTKCRHQVLLSYFGEADSTRCGTCDICLNRNKLDVSGLEFENVAGQVKTMLRIKPMNIDDVVHAVTGSKDEKTIKVIQWLIDNEKIIWGNDNKLCWAKGKN